MEINITKFAMCQLDPKPKCFLSDIECKLNFVCELGVNVFLSDVECELNFSCELGVNVFLSDIQASKKKVYMLYNLEPDRSVTGGAWYSDQDFESEFVEVLNQQCFKYLEQKVIWSENELGTEAKQIYRGERVSF